MKEQRTKFQQKFTSLIRALLLSLLLLCQNVINRNHSVESNREVYGKPEDEPQGPIFISEPPSQIAFANTKGALLSCTAYGRPAPILDWIHADGSPVDDVEGVLHILPNNSLHFLPFKDDQFRRNIHQASYRCIARNNGGVVVSRTVNVKGELVRQYSSYNVRVNDEYVTLGNTAVFKCSIDPYFVRGYIQVVAWTQGPNYLDPGDRFSILKFGELHVRNVRTEDSFQKYRCVTKNMLTGDEKSSDPASLYVMEPVNTSPVIEDALHELTVKENDHIELPCAATGFPLPNYSWMKDNAGLVLDHDRIRQIGGNLVINHVSTADSGKYECSAQNSLGLKTSVTQLLVTAPLSVFVDPPKQTIDVGHNATYNCTIYGNPISNVQWYKNGKPVELDNRVTLSTNQRRLNIIEVQRQDRGMYQCLVTNKVENAQGGAQLTLGDVVFAAKPVMHPTITFKDQHVHPGSRISLRCVTSGNPLPVIKWMLDDKSLSLSDPRFEFGQYSTPDGDVYSYVNITKIQITDGGTYTCISTNREGEARHQAKVYVYGVPYIRPMPNITAIANGDLVIKCYVAGYPVQSVTWSSGNVNLPINHRQHIAEDGTLTILDVQRNYDEGEYSCSAVNDNGEGSSRKFFITVAEPPSIDPFRFPKRRQGERVRVTCFVSRGDTPMTIEWLKDGKPISPDVGIVITKTDAFTSTLSITNSHPQHDGNFTCLATNKAATVNYTAAFHVDVPPSWVVEPEDSYVILHKDVTLDCQTTGKPEPRATWKKAKGNEPSNYERVGLSLDGRVRHLPNGSLQITKAEEQDHGYYLCHASNGISAGLSKVVFLTVHIPARFDKPRANYTVQKNTNVAIDCDAIGDKPISVSWSFNREDLNWEQNRRLDVRTEVTKSGKSSHLMITPVLRTDTGFYVCHTKNAFGQDSLPIELIVVEPAEAPKGLKVESRDSRSIGLSWGKPFDGNKPIAHYFIQYKNSTDPWRVPIHNMSISGNETRALLSFLHPSYTYHIRVVADNSIALGKPSNVLTVTTTEEAPTGAPRSVRVLPTGSQTLHVVWESPNADMRNGPIQGYYIGYRKFNTTQPFIYITTKVGKGFKPEQSITNLEKFTKYEVHVLAYNAKGSGPKSRAMGVLTLEDVPSQPPQDVYATPLSSQSIMVLWQPPPLYTLHGVLQGYKILYKIVREDEDESDAQFITSRDLKVVIRGLDKFTNYSLQVLAYTRMGEGIRSRPIYVKTKQDLPGQPADVKALPVGEGTILISWKPPLHSNGIITEYNVYMKYENFEGRMVEKKSSVPPTEKSYLAKGLKKGYEYFFTVTALTSMGEGERTREVKSTPEKEVAARVASFSSRRMVEWKSKVMLPCRAVGEPKPEITWTVKDKPIVSNGRFRIYYNGSLEIDAVESADAANYTCRAQNVYGADEITIALVVQAPPKKPVLTVAAATSTSIQINWRSGSNGGSAMQGFIFYYKKAFQDWKNVKLKPQVRSYTVNSLYCGTQYKFQLQAFNRAGLGEMSDVAVSSTNGTTPIMPAQSLLIKHLNSTYLVLDLRTWLNGGCPLTSFAVRYKIWGETHWTTVSNHIEPSVAEFVVRDLHPATWYMMKVTAYNDAGLTESELKFATLTYTGSTIKPLTIVHRPEAQFYERAGVMVPLCLAFMILIGVNVGVILYCKRRRDRLRYKVVSYNLRRDLTAETSLMNDLDKRFPVFESDTSRDTYGVMPYTPEPIVVTQHRNNNLLTDRSQSSSDSQDGAAARWEGPSASGGQNNATNSDNSFNSVSDSDGQINPYATFEYPRDESMAFSTISRPHGASNESKDEIEIEKAKAQKEAGFQATLKKVLGPKDKKQQSPPTKDQPPKQRYQNVPNCEMENLYASRKYASADQIHALFNTCPHKYHVPYHVINQNTYTYRKPPKSHVSSSDEKGSQRHSNISSVTTVSSNQEELMQAYECAKKNQSLFEFMSQKASPPGTDSSESTEPGIRQFTSSPPKPDEKRQAACEVPLYDGAGHPRLDISSTEAEAEAPETKKHLSPARKSRTRRGRTRGNIVGKKILRAARGPPRTTSRISNDSTNSEEVTYSFEDKRLNQPSTSGLQSSSNSCMSPINSANKFVPQPSTSRAFMSPPPSTSKGPFSPRGTSRAFKSPPPRHGPVPPTPVEQRMLKSPPPPVPKSSPLRVTSPPTTSRASPEGAYRIDYDKKDDSIYGEYDTYSKRRKVRQTPKPRHDITPDTPGTDEHRPLVTALAKPALTSPQEEEDDSGGFLEKLRQEEEQMALLERHYRTVKEGGAVARTPPISEMEPNIYDTANFTVV